MRFKLWLEEIEKDLEYWQKFFLAVFHLDKHQDGLGKNLAGFDPKPLIKNSEFSQLEKEIQETIVNMIQQGRSTIGDIARIAAGEDRSVKTTPPSFSLPVKPVTVNPLTA